MRIQPLDGLRIYKKNAHDALYERAPFEKGGFERSIALIKEEIFDRKELVNILLHYNDSIGNDEKAKIAALSLLDKNIFAFVTGQQPGLMGGPSYTILKAITCLAMASRHKVPAIFWLASEDHDLDEVGKTFVIDSSGNLKRYRLMHQERGYSLDRLTLKDDSLKEIHQFQKDFSLPKLQIERSYSKAMAQVLATLFQGTGLIFIEPKFLKPLAKPFLTNEIELTAIIQDLFEKENLHLKKWGIEVPFPERGKTNLFMENSKGERKRLFYSHPHFHYEGEILDRDTVLHLIEEAPERFTSSVLSRPLMASSLIPTGGVVLGPAELNYFLGLKSYFRLHGLIMPWLCPRISATLIPEKEMSIIQKSTLDLKALLLERGDQRKVEKRIKESGIQGMDVNLIENLCTPHGKFQERVLNWFYFQSKSTINLIKELIKEINPEELRHLLISDYGTV